MLEPVGSFCRLGDGSSMRSIALFQGLTLAHFRLNISTLCGIGVALRGCLGSVEEVLGGIRRY